MLKRSDTTFNKKLFQYSGESRISPRWGRQPSGGANIRICQIFPKTATANRKNLDPRGRTSLVPPPPLDPPVQYDVNRPLAKSMCFIMNKIEHVRRGGGRGPGSMCSDVQVEQV